MELSISKVIDRPPSVVFRFVAVEHLRNHPRWDTEMHLEQLTDGPVGVGTRFHRRRTTMGPPIEGTMEVVGYEPERAMAAVIHDETPGGPIDIRSSLTTEPVDEGRTRLTVYVDITGLADATGMTAGIEASLDRMKQMIEAET
jgi:uncharacterized protein YndB with AHSA1/START domain